MLKLTRYLRKLQHGIASSSLTVNVDGQKIIIQLPMDMNARILIANQNTQIEAADEKTRALLRDVVLHDIVELA
jgi:hypothetical protein